MWTHRDHRRWASDDPSVRSRPRRWWAKIRSILIRIRSEAERDPIEIRVGFGQYSSGINSIFESNLALSDFQPDYGRRRWCRGRSGIATVSRMSRTGVRRVGDHILTHLCATMRDSFSTVRSVGMHNNWECTVLASRDHPRYSHHLNLRDAGVVRSWLDSDRIMAAHGRDIGSRWWPGC